VGRSAWGLEIERDQDWRQRAACGPATAEWFYFHSVGRGAHLSEDNKAALHLCEQCPVRQQCYNDAAASPETDARIAGGAVWRRGQVRHPVGLAADEVERLMRRRETWRTSSRRRNRKREAA